MRFHLHRESPWIPVILISILIGCWSELDLYAPSFPQMLDYFKTTNEMMQWTLSLNFLGFFVAALLCGPLADAYGRRPVILGGSLLFVLGSLLCVIATDMDAMLLGRFVQGLGVSAPTTVCMAVIADIYQGDRQVKLISRMNTSVTIVMALAPIIGSYLAEAFGWRANFMVIFGVAISGCSLIWLLVPETHAHESRVTFSARSLFSSYWILLKDRNFMMAVLGLCLAITPYFIFIGNAPHLFQRVLGLSIDSYAFYQGSVVAIFAGLSLLIPVALRKWNVVRLMGYSIIASVAALFVSFVFSVFIPDNAMLITGLMWVYTVGIVLPPTLMFSEAMDMNPSLRACSSSLIQALRMLFMAGGIALAGKLYDDRYFFPIAVMFAFLILSLPFVISTIRRRSREGATGEISASGMH